MYRKRIRLYIYVLMLNIFHLCDVKGEDGSSATTSPIPIFEYQELFLEGLAFIAIDSFVAMIFINVISNMSNLVCLQRSVKCGTHTHTHHMKAGINLIRFSERERIATTILNFNEDFISSTTSYILHRRRHRCVLNSIYVAN